MKLNIDFACDDIAGFYGIGVAIWDDKGVFIVGKYVQGQGRFLADK